MVNITQYKLADCRLFRTPPLDFTYVGRSIEDALLAAWQNGQDANAALDSVIDNGQILSPLSKQIAANLAFQKTVGLNRLEAESRNVVAEYDAKKQEEIAKVQNTLGQQVDSEKERLARLKSEEGKKRAGYDAAQTNLDQIKYKLRARLEKIGGLEGYETLFQINDRIVQDDSPEKEKPTHPANQNYTTQTQSTLEQIAAQAPEEQENREPIYDQNKQGHDGEGHITSKPVKEELANLESKLGLSKTDESKKNKKGIKYFFKKIGGFFHWIYAGGN